MKKAWGIIKKGIVAIVGLAVFYGAQGLILLLIAGTIPFLDSCGYSKEDIEQAKKAEYERGYYNAVVENRDAWEKDAFSEGYSAALDDYDIEESVHIECPHCGINISADHDGYVNDWWW